MPLGTVFPDGEPAWGQIEEDELSALKGVGIFVAVAAGNNFSS